MMYKKYVLPWPRNPDSIVKIIKENRIPHHMGREAGLEAYYEDKNNYYPGYGVTVTDALTHGPPALLS